MKQIRCADVGYFPKCPDAVQGETEDEVMQKIFAHGTEKHRWPMKLRQLVGRQRFVDEATARARAAIRDV